MGGGRAWGRSPGGGYMPFGAFGLDDLYVWSSQSENESESFKTESYILQVSRQVVKTKERNFFI